MPIATSRRAVSWRFRTYGQVTGNGLADMLLGFVTYSGGARLDNPQYLRNTQLERLFVQDTWLASGAT